MPNIQFLHILKQFLQILKVRDKLHGHFVHPSCHRFTHALLESEAEGAVTAVAAVVCQLLCGDRLMGSSGLAIEIHKVIDTQIIDISIVSDAMTGEILAEIESVGANSLGKLNKSQIAL